MVPVPAALWGGVAAACAAIVAVGYLGARRTKNRRNASAKTPAAAALGAPARVGGPLYL